MRMRSYCTLAATSKMGSDWIRQYLQFNDICRSSVVYMIRSFFAASTIQNKADLSKGRLRSISILAVRGSKLGWKAGFPAMRKNGT